MVTTASTSEKNLRSPFRIAGVGTIPSALVVAPPGEAWWSAEGETSVALSETEAPSTLAGWEAEGEAGLGPKA